MLLLLTTLLVHLVSRSESASCVFNSMCICSYDPNSQRLHDVSCVAVPFYKFPSVPESAASHVEVQGTGIVSLERLAFTGLQMQSLTVANNKIQHVSDKVFSSTNKILSSVDLSYNELDSVPFSAMRDLRNLQWLNLHSNQIHSILGDWSHLKDTLSNLFLGGNDLTDMSSDTHNHYHGIHQFKVLIMLNLDNNKISKLHRHSFPAGLQTLSLSHNLLETFPLDAISNLPQLQWLYLRGNHLKNLPEYTFTKKMWLEKLDLSENYLKELPKNTFNNSIYVRDLNLAFNNIQTLTSESFLGLNCGRIILSHNGMESIDRKALSGLQESLEYLDLDHNSLSHIPHALNYLKQLKYLYLSSNLLTDIPQTSFQFCYNLKALSLSGNRLLSIPSQALMNCSRVSHFNVGYNEIYELLENDFEWGVNIRTLLLRNNRLTSLKERVFQTLRNLKELSLSFNPLRYIDANVFQDLVELDSLEMSFGLDREDFPAEILKPLASLQWLALDYNNFKTLSENGLADLSQLRYINMEGNKIERIPITFFRGTIHSFLQDIRLANNELVTIATNTFTSLGNLQTVTVFGNKLRQVERHAFNDLVNLTTLILSDNYISYIHPEAFSDLPILTKLDLQSNKLSELSFKVFTNVSIFSSMFLNVSDNHIAFCKSDNKIINIEVFDLSHNTLNYIPQCLENVATLKKLLLDNNNVSYLGHNSFMHLSSLETLNLAHNSINNIHKHAFFGLQNLQILDLSYNYLTQLHTGQFISMSKLRVVTLRSNRLKYLPKDIFGGTVLEMLDLSSNSFNVIPSLTLSVVGTTLRHLVISDNFVEHVDSTTFPDFPFLQYLDLSNNKLTILPDNVFASLGHLQKLNLASNTLRANFKELFHYAQSLKELNLANIGISSTPHLPLPNLVHLNLSHNNIKVISKASIQDLSKLKYLYLNYNKMTTIPSHVWVHTPLLKTLDISYNPIKEITIDSFYGLHNLQNLNIFRLKYLERFDSKSLSQLKILSSLTIQTWPNLENFRAQFCILLANLTRLTTLKLYIEENTLDDQLVCVSSNKIRHLQVSGRNLKFIERDAFAKFTKNPELLIQIKDTQIEDLPAGLFTSLDKVSHLSIDLRNNLLSYLSPDIFYANATTWKNIGTTLISGGLLVSQNPWRCGCHLAWLGHWMRRWARESLQSHTASVDATIRINGIVKEATCVDLRTGQNISLVQLAPEDMSCHASALSKAAEHRTSVILFTVLSWVWLF